MLYATLTMPKIQMEKFCRPICILALHALTHFNFNI